MPEDRTPSLASLAASLDASPASCAARFELVRPALPFLCSAMRCLLQKGRLRIARSDPEEHFTFSGPSIAGLLGCQILRQLLQRLLLQCLLLKLLLQRLIDRVLLIDQVLRSHAIRLRSLANLTGSENVAQSVAERA